MCEVHESFNKYDILVVWTHLVNKETLKWTLIWNIASCSVLDIALFETKTTPPLYRNMMIFGYPFSYRNIKSLRQQNINSDFKSCVFFTVLFFFFHFPFPGAIICCHWGYSRIEITGHQFYIHRLVALYQVVFNPPYGRWMADAFWWLSFHLYDPLTLKVLSNILFNLVMCPQLVFATESIKLLWYHWSCT